MEPIQFLRIPFMEIKSYLPKFLGISENTISKGTLI